MLLTSICFFSRHESSCSEVRTGWELDDQGGMNMLAYICIVFETSILISTRCYRLKPTEFFFFIFLLSESWMDSHWREK